LKADFKYSTATIRGLQICSSFHFVLSRWISCITNRVLNVWLHSFESWLLLIFRSEFFTQCDLVHPLSVPVQPRCWKKKSSFSRFPTILFPYSRAKAYNNNFLSEH
jgi:hypothetical protein